MLTIEIKLNGKLIAGSKIVNVSKLADISDYKVEAVERASPSLGFVKDFCTEFPIEGHTRRNSAWSLVEKVAREAALRRTSGQYDHEPRADQETF